MLIFNKADDQTTEIDIIGSIGQDFFGEGNTLQSVKAEVDAITTPNIRVNIDSLGGAVNDGFAIHDLLATHPATVTANIIGWTASAGTIVAMGADRIEITENAFFLIHNSWTLAIGNADEMRDSAEILDKIDAKMVAIYRGKTGMRKSAIKSLMAEEKWLSAEEAKEMGFVDQVNKARKVAASLDNKELLKAGLPTMPERINNSLTQIKNDMEIKEAFADLKDFIANALQGNAESDVQEVKILDTEEVQNKLADYEAKADEVAGQIEAKDAEIAALQAKVSEYEAKEAAAAAGETPVANNDEPAITEEPSEDANEFFADLFRSGKWRTASTNTQK